VLRLLSYTLVFALQLRKKSRKNLSGRGKVPGGHVSIRPWLPRQTATLKHLCLAIQAVKATLCRVAELRCCPHQLTLSRNSQSGLC
jgi:hypothetical protein